MICVLELPFRMRTHSGTSIQYTLPHSSIVTILFQQLLMCATFRNLPLVQDQDLIGMGDGAEAMSDNQHCSAMREGRDDGLVSVWSERRGR